jgi:hypothetical protein
MGMQSILGTIEAYSAYTAGVTNVGLAGNPYIWMGTTTYMLTSGVNKMCDCCISTRAVDDYLDARLAATNAFEATANGIDWYIGLWKTYYGLYVFPSH